MAVSLAPACGTSWGNSGTVTQPIAFDHSVHIEEDLACVDCHKGVESSPYATLPTIKRCLLCHEEPLGEHPEEARVREYAETTGHIPWVRVNRLPGHVYFSHAAHVTYAGMACAECHGPMEGRTRPVESSQIGHLDMDRCVSCHEERGASTDCLGCHK